MWLIILNVILFGLIAVVFNQRLQEPFKKQIFWLGLTGKISAGLALGYLYLEVMGSGDTLRFFEEGKKIMEIAELSFQQYLTYMVTSQFPDYMSASRNEAFLKVINPVFILSGGNYWIISCWLSFLSFLTCWYFFQIISRHNAALALPIIIGFFFIPSAVFWSSGLMKDTVINSALIFMLAISYKYYYSLSFKKWEWVLTFCSLWVLLNIKFYLAGLVVIGLILLLFNELGTKLIKGRGWRWAIGAAFLLSGIFLVSRINWNLHLENFPHAVYENYQTIYFNSHPEKRLEFDLNATWSGLMTNAPESFLAGMFRPFIWEGTLTNLIYGIENMILLFLFVLNLFLMVRKRVKISLLVWLSMGYIGILATVLPLVSPNFGSLERYKAAYIPLLFFLLLVIPFRAIGRRNSKTSNLHPD